MPPAEARTSCSNDDEQRRNGDVHEARTPNIIRSNNQGGKKGRGACRHKQSKNYRFAARPKNPRNGVEANQKDRSENKEAFLRRTENTERVGEKLQWRMCLPKL